MKRLFALLAALLAGTSTQAETNISEVLLKLDAVLESKRPEFAAGLRPPLTVAQIAQMEAQYQVVLPDAVRALYLWHDGQGSSNYMSFVNNMQFQPLSEVLSAKAEFDEMIGYDFELENWWHPAWLPLFHNGGGDFIVVDRKGVHTGTKNQLLTVYHDWKYRPIVAKDLATFLAAALEYHEATPIEQMDEFHIIDDFLPQLDVSFEASGKATPLE